MTQQTNLDKIKFIVAHAKANLNLCVAAYQIIEKTNIEYRPVLMEAFIKGFKNTRTDESIEIPVVFDAEKEQAYIRRYQRIVDGHLEEFLNAGYDKEEFYIELTNYIMTDKNLLDDGARAFAIFDCCIDKRLPYACVDLTSGLQMENEEFAKYIEQLGDEIDRINYILDANLQQKTERASLLLREIDTCESYKERTVLLATILNRYESDALRKALLQIKLSSDPDFADLLSDD